MFGMRAKPKGLFGSPGQGILPGDQPDAGMGDFPSHNLPQTNEAPQKRGGAFGSGVAWGDVLYALGGAIGGDGGAAVQHVKQSRLAPLMEQAQREAEWADWRRKKQWEIDNRPPANNDTINDMEAAAKWTPEQWAIYDRLHPVWKTGPDGLPYAVPRPAMGVPTRPVGKLTPIGGPSQPATGMFP